MTGFEQRLGRGFLLDRPDDIRFGAETEMDVAINQSRQHGMSAAIDANGATRNRDAAAGTGRVNSAFANDDSRPFDGLSVAVDQPGVMDGDGHGVIPRSET